MQGLYVHIPFCVKKCGYCDFYSEVASDDDAQRYLDALERELEMRICELGPISPRTVFFGGGTPTKLSAKQLASLGQVLHRHVDLSRVEEWSSEINPGTLDPAKADAMVEMGVNRASIGVQSFNPRFLKELDRSHEEGKAEEAVGIARRAGIENVSVDLMFALPTQTREEWQDDLERALTLNTQHISLYALTYEDDTPLTGRMLSGEVEPLADEVQAEMYEWTVERCRRAELERYEVSNFAKPGFESRHNTLYWRCQDWLGIGPAAHSACGRLRWANIRDHKEYASALLDQGRLPLALDEQNTPEQYADELLMMGLRLRTGVLDDDYRARVGVGIAERYCQKLEQLVALNLVNWDGTTLALTDKGFPLLDKIVVELCSSALTLAQTE